jgi:hypothetical protein
MVVRLALSAGVLMKVIGCAPKGGNLGRRANAPTPGGIEAASQVPVLPAGDLVTGGR